MKSKERRRLLQLLLISLGMVLLLRTGIRVGRRREEGTRGKDALGRESGKHVSSWWLLSWLHELHLVEGNTWKKWHNCVSSHCTED